MIPTEDPKKVLVVDDDDAIRTMVERVLRREKFHVESARDGHEAIEKLSSNDYGTIVLDLMMPRVDGLGVLRFLETARPESTRSAPMAVLFHTRLTRPLLGMVLVLLGLSVILRDQNRNVFISAGMCLVLCALFFAACFACRQLGDNEIFSPALAAWLPVIGFGPLAFVMFDAVHT